MASDRNTTTSNMDSRSAVLVALLLRFFYLAASAFILVLRAIPALPARFLAYGSRATSLSHPARPSTALERLLDCAAAFQLPHGYFTHFYIVSVASSLFWAWKLGLASAAAGGVAQTAWLLMLLQGVRRLGESCVYTSSSRSSMWVAHWVLGCLFYLATNVAVWIELEPEPTPRLGYVKAAVLVPAILTAHYLQHSYHAYLYHLRTANKGYQLPSHPLFQDLLCPHYTCEVAIYLLLALLAAPPGSMVNWTLLSASVFVFVNLGVTAVGTKEWYAERFGESKVRGRKRMVPYLW